VIHQEPLVGTTAFWFTRPLPRADLLLSKTIYVLLLILVPLLVQTLVFVINGVTAHDVLLAIPELFLRQFSWIILVATLAVLTPNFARFAIIGASALVVWYLGLFVLEMFLLMRHPESLASTAASLTSSRGVVSSGVVISLGCAAVIVQYLTRRTAVTTGLAVIAASLGLVAQFLWPWDFLKPPPKFVAVPDFPVAAVTVKLTGPIRVSDQIQLRGGTPLKQVQGQLDFQGQPKGCVIKVESIDSKLKTADGRDIPVQTTNTSYDFSFNVKTAAVEAALADATVLNGSPDYPFPHTLFSITAETYTQYGDTPLAYSARIDVQAYKYVVTTELPLTKGSRYDHESEHLTMTDVLTQPDGIDVALRERRMHLLFAPQSDAANPYVLDRSSQVYLLLNKKLHQAVIQKQDMSVNFSMLNKGMLVNQPLRISFGPDENSSNNSTSPILDKAWLANAVLVRLDLVPVVAFTRTISVPGFRLDGKFALPNANSTSQSETTDLLAQITLPDHATPDQVRNYIRQIVAFGNQRGSGKAHPQEMLEQVGPQNLDLLIEALQNDYNYQLDRAIDDLVQADQKQMILQALPATPRLIDTVVNHEWQQDAKPTVLAALTGDIQDLSTSYIIAAPSYKDPATYPAIQAYYIQNPSRFLFENLQSLPNFDLAGMVDRAWKQRDNGSIWKTGELLGGAAQFGEPGVLEAAITMLESDHFSKPEARRVLRQYTPITGHSDADMIAWWNANKDNVVFDPQAHKFILRPAPATAAPAPSVPVPSAPVPAAH
jgi:hypothetical protein